MLRLPPCHLWPLWNICVTNDHGYVPLVVNTSLSFPHSWLIAGFVTRLTRRRVQQMDQELPLSWSICVYPGFKWGSCYSIFSSMCMFCRSFFFLVSFFFWSLCCMFFFDIRFWLHLLYLQTILVEDPWYSNTVQTDVRRKQICISKIETIDQSIIDDNINGSFNICQH